MAEEKDKQETPKKKTNTRKILENNYESTDIDTRKQEFKLDNSVTRDLSIEDRIDYKMVYDEIESCIKGSIYETLNQPDENGKYKKLNKADINRIYSHVIGLKPKVSKVEVFSVLSEYFDINYYKFYDSLSNTFKQELIEELSKSNSSLRKRIGGQLF